MASTTSSPKFLSQAEASQIDVDLMSSEYAFSLPVLMELAGLSVAEAVNEVFPQPCRVLAVAGPGNNGGDALVACRHLALWGYKPTVVYPKRTAAPLFADLVTQCKKFNIPLEESMPSLSTINSDFDVIIDGIFGFGFQGDVRPPFDAIISDLTRTKVPIVSIDIPSSWDVEKGDFKNLGLKPHVLVSLTAPKKCAQFFQGHYHFVGGRFVPPSLAHKFGLNLPQYERARQVVLLSRNKAPK